MTKKKLATRLARLEDTLEKLTRERQKIRKELMSKMRRNEKVGQYTLTMYAAPYDYMELERS